MLCSAGTVLGAERASNSTAGKSASHARAEQSETPYCQQDRETQKSLDE
jgi:hypothetical protein